MTRRRFGTIRKLPSDRFQASYAGPDGKRYLAPHTFTKRHDAEKWIRAEEALIETGAVTSRSLEFSLPTISLREQRPYREWSL